MKINIPVNETRKKNLGKALGKGEVVVVAGTGVAVASTNKHHCSTWDGLIRHGIQYCIDNVDGLHPEWNDMRLKELATKDIDEMIGAAQQVSSKLKKAKKFESWLENSIGSMKLEDDILPKAIADLGVPILTTNYDNIFEKATNYSSFTWRDQDHFQQILKDRKKGILHLHGHWEVGDSVIFGFDSYGEISTDEYTKALTQAIISLKTFLFIGCGGTFEDPHFAAIRDWTKNKFKKSKSSHFVLACIKDKDNFDKMFTNDEPIEIIWYEDHAELPALLESLTNSLKSESYIEESKDFSIESFFDYRTGNTLTAFDILRTRSKKDYGFNEMYFMRDDVDGVLANLVEKNKNVLLTGKQLAGKSRAILNYLQNNHQKTKIYILKKGITNFEKCSLNNSNENSSLVFYVINDIDEYVLSPGFKKYFEILTKTPNTVILATCMLSEMDSLQNELDESFKSLTELNIKPLSASLRENLQKYQLLDESIAPDDTIGSFFITIDLYKAYYDKLDFLEKEILRAYKCLRFSKNTDDIDIDLIITFIQDYRSKNFSQNELKLFPIMWKKSFDNLKKIGFILEKEANTIFIEPSYLEKIIATNEKEYKLAAEVCGFYLDILIINVVLEKVKFPTNAWAIYLYARDVLSIEFDINTFHILITRAVTFEEATIAYEDMILKIKPNIITFNKYINKATKSKDVWLAYDEMIENNIQPDASTFQLIINRIDDDESVWITYQEMMKNQIQLSIASFKNLISKTKNFEKAWDFYNKALPNLNEKLDDSVWKIFMSLIKNKKQKDLIILEAMKWGYQLGDPSYLPITLKIKIYLRSFFGRNKEP